MVSPLRFSRDNDAPDRVNYMTMSNADTASTRSRAARLTGWFKSAAQVLFVLAGIAVIYRMQTHNLLETVDTPAPRLDLPTLDGGRFDLARRSTETALVYFFAPWCHVCAASAHNLRALRRSREEQELSMVMVALDWETVEEVRQYVTDHDIDATVVLGDRQTATDWQVFGYPTYYVVDSAGQIAHRDFGYSTEIGLRWRTRSSD